MTGDEQLWMFNYTLFVVLKCKVCEQIFLYAKSRQYPEFNCTGREILIFHLRGSRVTLLEKLFNLERS